MTQLPKALRERIEEKAKLYSDRLKMVGDGDIHYSGYLSGALALWEIVGPVVRASAGILKAHNQKNLELGHLNPTNVAEFTLRQALARLEKENPND